MKSILDLAYGLLAGRPETPAVKAKGADARDGARTRRRKAAAPKAAKTARAGAAGKPRKKGAARAAGRTRAR